jgi:HdeA/HdeB family protein
VSPVGVILGYHDAQPQRKGGVMNTRELGLAVMLMAGAPAMASAQMNLIPRTIKIEVFTCGELLSLPGEQRDRALVYYNGYFDGLHKETTWDERVIGRRIDEVVAKCHASSSNTLLRVFSEVWPR